MSFDEIQDVEWEVLYKRLLKFLSDYGEDDFLGKKEYWIVDDNWGSAQHKICIYKSHVFCEEVFYGISNCLKDMRLDWEVICVWCIEGEVKDKDVALVRKNGISYTNSSSER